MSKKMNFLDKWTSFFSTKDHKLQQRDKIVKFGDCKNKPLNK